MNKKKANSKEIISWEEKFKSFNSNANERTFENLMAEVALALFGYATQEVTYQNKKTDIHCLPNAKLHGLVIETKKPSEWPVIKDAVYDFPNEQVKKYLLREYSDLAGEQYHPKYGMLVNKTNLILYENRFGRLFKILDFTDGSLLVDTDRKLKEVLKTITRNSQGRKSLIASVFNNKGGVGKSSLSFGISKSLGKDYDKMVFAVDLDPLQADLSRLFGITAQDSLVDVIELLNFNKKNFKAKLEEIREKKMSLLKVFSKDKVHVSLSKPEQVEKGDKSYFELHKEITWAGKGKLKEIGGKLRDFLKVGIIKEGYHFTILDTPAGWWFYSILSVFVSDMIIIPVSAKSKSSWKNAVRFITHYLPSLQEEFEDILPAGRIQPGPIVVNFWEKGASQKDHSATIQEIYDYMEKELPNNRERKQLLENLFPSISDKDGYPDFSDTSVTPSFPDTNAISSFDLEKVGGIGELNHKSKEEFKILTRAIFPKLEGRID
jgi:cellulose biosynthesis protein BcsQ